MGLFNPTNNRGRGSGDRKGHRLLAKGLRAAKKRRPGSALFTPSLFPAVDAFPDSATTYSTPGTHTFTVPRGVDTIRVHLYGAGGGAANFHGSGRSAIINYNGNGGAFVGVTIGEIPKGTQITFTVGAGGSTSTTGGNTGGSSFFTYDGASLTAGGGFGGHFQTTAYGGFFGQADRLPGAVGVAEGATSGTTQGVIGINLINGNPSNNSSFAFFGGMVNSGIGTGGSGDNGSATQGQGYSRGGKIGNLAANNPQPGDPGLVVIF